MRVALLVPGGIGPAGQRIHIPPLTKLVERLSTQFDITVYSLNAGDRQIETLRCGNAVVRYVNATYESSFPQKIFSLASEFLREHSRKRYELLHAFWAVPCGALAVYLGKRNRVPSVVSLLGGETAHLPQIRYGNLARRSTGLLTRWTCRNADRLVVLTQHQADQLRQLGWHHRDLRIIPLGADEMFIRRERSRRPTPPYRFLHVGSMTEVKDQPTLLKTFASIARCVKAELRVVGADYMNGAIQQLARDLGIGESVRFVGQIPHDHLTQQYDWADVLLHTSLHEAQSVVVAEAAASRVVVAGTNVGLIADLGSDGCTIAEPGDHEGLARKVLELLENPSRYDRLQTHASRWAVEHGLNWAVDAYAYLYDQMRLNGRGDADRGNPTRSEP